MMKLTRFILVLTVLLTQSTFAIENIPDRTLLWNRFVEVLAFDRYVLALGERGITLFEGADTGQTLLEKSHEVLPAQALTMKLEGLVIVVRLVDGSLIFINFERIDNLEILGVLRPSFDYYDFALYEDQLYLSRWFDGIDRYRVTNFGELTYIENIRPGVVMTQLHIVSHFLYALDLYNGVNLYDLKAGFKDSSKKLLLNERPFAINVFGYTVFISMNRTGAVVGDFSGDSAVIRNFIADIPSPEIVLGAGNYLVFLSNREVNMLNRDTFAKIANVSLDSEQIGGTIGLVGGEARLLLPEQSGGIASLEISNLDNKREVLNRPGPISSILIHNNNLFTGGGGNPLEVYEIESDSLLAPLLIRDTITGVTDLEILENRLYALYAHERKVVVFDMAGWGGVIEPVDSFFISIDKANQLIVQDSLLLIIGRSQIELRSGDVGEVIWDIGKPITHAAASNNELFVTDRFGSIESHEIQNDLSLLKCSERDLTGTGWAMQEFNNRLFVFTGNTATVFESCLELDTIVRLPFFVLDAAMKNDTLYTIGPDGIAKYDLTTGLPILIESGGLGGSQISAAGGVMATTDGSSIHLYFEGAPTDGGDADADAVVAKSVILHENYPEPFNAATTIHFELPLSSDINLSIFNLLGQRVKLLADRHYAAGKYSISWDGTDESGSEAASGVYFYKLETELGVLKRKMLLIK